MNIYSTILRPLLYVLSGNNPERAHKLAIWTLKLCGIWPLNILMAGLTSVRNEVTVFGITFPNPVGTAAGFDKHALALKGIEAFGFGFAEVGTVTPVPQPGNPRPRLFRLDEDKAVINRFGFNSNGIEFMARQLQKYPMRKIPVAVNLGKNKDTPLENAADDYEKGLKVVYPYADFFVINISSPNTKDLRSLQEKDKLATLLDRVAGVAKTCAGGKTVKPILLKIAPDLTNEQLNDVLEVSKTRVQGLIVSNTTIERPEHLQSKHKAETGGLSGKPITARALELVRYVHQKLPDMPIIGVGGIFTPEDALRMLDAGASLIELYTGLVYEGPLLAHRINKAIKKRNA